MWPLFILFVIFSKICSYQCSCKTRDTDSDDGTFYELHLTEDTDTIHLVEGNQLHVQIRYDRYGGTKDPECNTTCHNVSQNINTNDTISFGYCHLATLEEEAYLIYILVDNIGTNFSGFWNCTTELIAKVTNTSFHVNYNISLNVHRLKESNDTAHCKMDTELLYTAIGIGVAAIVIILALTTCICRLNHQVKSLKTFKHMQRLSRTTNENNLDQDRYSKSPFTRLAVPLPDSRESGIYEAINNHKEAPAPAPPPISTLPKPTSKHTLKEAPLEVQKSKSTLEKKVPPKVMVKPKTADTIKSKADPDKDRYREKLPLPQPDEVYEVMQPDPLLPCYQDKSTLPKPNSGDGIKDNPLINLFGTNPMGGTISPAMLKAQLKPVSKSMKSPTPDRSLNRAQPTFKQQIAPKPNLLKPTQFDTFTNKTQPTLKEQNATPPLPLHKMAAKLTPIPVQTQAINNEEDSSEDEWTYEQLDKYVIKKNKQANDKQAYDNNKQRYDTKNNYGTHTQQSSIDRRFNRQANDNQRYDNKFSHGYETKQNQRYDTKQNERYDTKQNERYDTQQNQRYDNNQTSRYNNKPSYDNHHYDTQSYDTQGDQIYGNEGYDIEDNCNQVYGNL